MVFYSNWFFK